MRDTVSHESMMLVLGKLNETAKALREIADKLDVLATEGFQDPDHRTADLMALASLTGELRAVAFIASL